MLDIQITGTLPQVNTDLSSFFKQAEEIMLASVQLNLLSGGRPPFNVRSESVDHTPLNASGKMYRGVMGKSDAMSATVYMDSSVVSKKGHFYPQTLNDGAEIPPVEGKLMVFEINVMTVFTYKRAGFHLGPFPFMILQEEDKPRILELLPSAIFSQQGEIV